MLKEAFVLNGESTFEMAVKALDQGGIGFLALVNNSGSLEGIITDGDIRRAILKKNYNLDEMMNKKPEVMDFQSRQSEIIARLKQLHRRHMPLIDTYGNFKGVFSLDDIEFVSRENSVVIMAGGLGTRLGELTKETPKPMLEIGDRPMLQHILIQFRDQGFYKFILCLNYKKEIIQDFFKDGSAFGVSIEYVIENNRLGTAGALSLINKNSISKPFFVINADVMVNIDFLDVLNSFIASKAKALMCIRTHEVQIHYGVINLSATGDIESIAEKPVLDINVNAGIYVLSPDMLDLIPLNEYFDMPTLFEKLLSAGEKSSVYKLDDYWVDVGKIEDFNKANDDFKINNY